MVIQMSDELKKFLNDEIQELKRNKIRTAAIGVCLIFLIGIWIADYISSSEEIDLSDSADSTVKSPPDTKDMPKKPLPVPITVDGVTPVLGAVADPLIIADPFAGQENFKPSQKIIEPVTIQQSQIPQPPQEKITLTGVALGVNKTAMFKRDNETIFLTIGDELNGRKIVDITADFVTFADGSRLFVQKDVN